MGPSLDGALYQLTALNLVNEAILFSLDQGFLLIEEADVSPWAKRAAPIAEQMFSALHSIQRAHNEIRFEFDGRLIIVYEITDSVLLLLSADPQINFSLLDLGVKSVTAKVKEPTEDIED